YILINYDKMFCRSLSVQDTLLQVGAGQRGQGSKRTKGKDKTHRGVKVQTQCYLCLVGVILTLLQ
ncbi:hypothetical protein DKP78_19635, partial [Enterococcus faecium]